MIKKGGNTMKQHMHMIGQKIKHNLNNLVINIKVLDVRKSYNRIEYQITPVAGSGTVWIVAPKETKGGE
jgi:hypothetical protein